MGPELPALDRAWKSAFWQQSRPCSFCPTLRDLSPTCIWPFIFPPASTFLRGSGLPVLLQFFFLNWEGWTAEDGLRGGGAGGAPGGYKGHSPERRQEQRAEGDGRDV